MVVSGGTAWTRGERDIGGTAGCAGEARTRGGDTKRDKSKSGCITFRCCVSGFRLDLLCWQILRD